MLIKRLPNSSNTPNYFTTAVVHFACIQHQAQKKHSNISKNGKTTTVDPTSDWLESSSESRYINENNPQVSCFYHLIIIIVLS
jgi:hypothetical protein